MDGDWDAAAAVRIRDDLTTKSEETDSDDEETSQHKMAELYDPHLDEQDELWVQKKIKSSKSDAVLNCPACFTTLCLDSQRHERYLTQYRAVFVQNCKITPAAVYDSSQKKAILKRKRNSNISHKSVSCSICMTPVGVVDSDDVFHFLNVLPSH